MRIATRLHRGIEIGDNCAIFETFGTLAAEQHAIGTFIGGYLDATASCGLLIRRNHVQARQQAHHLSGEGVLQFDNLDIGIDLLVHLGNDTIDA